MRQTPSKPLGSKSSLIPRVPFAGGASVLDDPQGPGRAGGHGLADQFEVGRAYVLTSDVHRSVVVHFEVLRRQGLADPHRDALVTVVLDAQRAHHDSLSAGAEGTVPRVRWI